MGDAGARWRSDRDDFGTDAYDARWRALQQQGLDIHGEVNLVISLNPHSVLDAGCGTGRVAIELARRNVSVVGVDLDAEMLAAARQKAPALEWIEADLAAVQLDSRFDVVVMPGNVMIFVNPDERGAVIANMARHVAERGYLLSGFQLARRDRSLNLAEYDEHCAASGLTFVARWSTWDKAPFDGNDYAVTMHQLVV